MAVALAVLNTTAFVLVISANGCVRIGVGYSCMTHFLVRPREHHIIAVLGYLVTADNHPTERCVGNVSHEITQHIKTAVVVGIHADFDVIGRVQNRINGIGYHVFLMQFMNYLACLFIEKLNCRTSFYHVSSSSNGW